MKIIAISLDEELYEKLKQYAIGKYGDKENSIEKALGGLIRNYLNKDHNLIQRLEKGYPLGEIVDREELHKY